jgi:Ca2+-transporting ATPase
MLFSNQKKQVKSIFCGTLVASSLAVYRASNWPKYRGWEMGSSLQNIKETPTPLQIQIQKFVKVSISNYGYYCFLISLGCFLGKRITFN